VNTVSWTSVFVPKKEQTEKFILICHMLTPTDIKIWFDPVSHFLWQEMVVHKNTRWMCDNLPCTQMNRREIEKIELARVYLQEGIKLADATDMSSSGTANLMHRARQALDTLHEIK
jgi:hypothetical protein